MSKKPFVNGIITEPVKNGIKLSDKKFKKAPKLIDVLPYQFPLPGYFVFVAQPGSGKGYSCANMVHDYIDTGKINIIYGMGPTLNSATNHHLQSIPFKEGFKFTEDLMSGTVPFDCLTKIELDMQKVVKEFLFEEAYTKIYQKVLNNTATHSERIIYQKQRGRPPKPLIEPRFLLIIDDMSHSPLLHNNNGGNEFYNLSLRHRHIAGTPDRAFGLTIIVMVQTFLGGVPKALRDNAKVILLWHTSDKNMIKLYYSSFGECVDEHQFVEIFDIATETKHDFLVIDKHNKDINHVFRKNFDTYLFPRRRLSLLEIMYKSPGLNSVSEIGENKINENCKRQRTESSDESNDTFENDRKKVRRYRDRNLKRRR
jgi:hypothetical protein